MTLFFNYKFQKIERPKCIFFEKMIWFFSYKKIKITWFSSYEFKNRATEMHFFFEKMTCFFSYKKVKITWFFSYKKIKMSWFSSYKILKMSWFSSYKKIKMSQVSIYNFLYNQARKMHFFSGLALPFVFLCGKKNLCKVCICVFVRKIFL